jgi:hypothetical protein
VPSATVQDVAQQPGDLHLADAELGADALLAPLVLEPQLEDAAFAVLELAAASRPARLPMPVGPARRARRFA